jgi:HEAT repeat protein
MFHVPGTPEELQGTVEPLQWTTAARLTATQSVAGKRLRGERNPARLIPRKLLPTHERVSPTRFLRVEGAFMRTVALPRISALVFITPCLLFAQQQSTNAGSPPQTNAPAQQQPTNPSAPPPTHEPTQQPATKPQVSVAGPQPTATRTVPQTPKEEAWQILDTACTGDKTSDRATAVRVLGLMPNNARARKLAEKALRDDKPEVRSAAAAALGDMKSRTSILQLRAALDDNDPSVALAAAHSLELMHDDSAYEVYYEVLTGQRKASRGLIASQTSMLKDPKKVAQLGFEEGIGFVPFAGMGWGAIKAITKDDSSPVRAAAAKVLAKDPDPAATKALADAVGDKSWLVRAAALEALAKRGDPSVLDTVQLHVSDEKDAVKYTAAAAVLRLMAIKESGLPVMVRKKKENEKKRTK